MSGHVPIVSVDAAGLHVELAEITTTKAGGNLVYCRECGSTRECDHAAALRNGWPTCCGYTMTIDPPESEVTA